MVDNYDDRCEQLRRAFIASGMSQVDLVRKSGVHAPNLSRFLNGEARVISVEKLDQLAILLGSPRFLTRFDDILGDRDDPVVEINGKYIHCREEELNYEDVRLLAGHFWQDVGKIVEYESGGVWFPLNPGRKILVHPGIKLRLSECTQLS